MQIPESYVNERLDHLGLVTGVCEEIGLAAYLDGLAGETNHQVSMGTATVAMILNGLGFSNRRLYLVPQFFANKPIEHLLGAGIEAADLNDDCLDRTLDWLYAQDPTQLFAGIATQARKFFEVSARHVHVDTTSFSVSGAYATGEQEESEARVIGITYGYSRDHREDLKQWMLALATTQEGDVPLFLRPLDGNSSDKVTLASAVEALHEQLCTPASDPSFFVADSGVYSEVNMRRFNEAKIRWISRVPETSTEAKAVMETASESTEWHDSEDGQTHWFTRTMSLPQGQERWVVVRTRQGEARAQATLKRQVEKAEHSWKQKLWHLSNQRFACEADALAEHRLRTRLAETEQTIPDQLNRPTTRPTLRWIFQCFEGIELLHIRSASDTQSLILRLQPMHRLILALLGPPYEKIYEISS